MEGIFTAINVTVLYHGYLNKFYYCLKGKRLLIIFIFGLVSFHITKNLYFDFNLLLQLLFLLFNRINWVHLAVLTFLRMFTIVYVVEFSCSRFVAYWIHTLIRTKSRNPRNSCVIELPPPPLSPAKHCWVSSYPGLCPGSQILFFHFRAIYKPFQLV